MVLYCIWVVILRCLPFYHRPFPTMVIFAVITHSSWLFWNQNCLVTWKMRTGICYLLRLLSFKQVFYFAVKSLCATFWKLHALQLVCTIYLFCCWWKLHACKSYLIFAKFILPFEHLCMPTWHHFKASAIIIIIKCHLASGSIFQNRSKWIFIV